MVSSTCFELESLFQSDSCAHSYGINKLYHTCTYNRLPEDEPSVLKHADITKLKY
jgi:hypothetical protein